MDSRIGIPKDFRHAGHFTFAQADRGDQILYDACSLSLTGCGVLPMHLLFFSMCFILVSVDYVNNLFIYKQSSELEYVVARCIQL